jgi:hypothetical protein
MAVARVALDDGVCAASLRCLTWRARHMRLTGPAMSVITVSMTRLAVAVRVRASRVLRFPVLHRGGVTAEHF